MGEGGNEPGSDPVLSCFWVLEAPPVFQLLALPGHPGSLIMNVPCRPGGEGTLETCGLV